IWGRVDYHHLPSMTTLDTLAKFAGFETWRNFQKREKAVIEDSEKIKIVIQEQGSRRKARSRLFTWIILLVAGISIAAIWAMRRNESPPNSGDYSFSSEPLTHTIPNS